MRWPIWIHAWWVFILLQSAEAEEPIPPDPAGPPPHLQPDVVPQPSLLRQNAAAHFQLVLGRLHLDPVRYRKGSQTLLRDSVTAASANTDEVAETASKTGKIEENLLVEGVRGVPRVFYTLQNRGLRVSLDAMSEGRVLINIDIEPNDAPEKLVLNQSPGKPLTLTRTCGGKQHLIQAATLIHLFEADRALFTRALEPLINELLWPASFQQLAEEARHQSLLEPRETIIDDATVMRWVQDLSSPKRATRQAADRALSQMGLSLLPRLASLDRTRLDAEQRKRLSEIESRLRPRTEDNAARLAMLLRDDRSYWQLTSAKMNLHDQQRVIARFAQIGGQPPLADSELQSTRVAAGEAGSYR